MDRIIKYLPAIIISLITLRITIFGAGIGDAISILACAGLFGYDKFLAKQEVKDPTEDMKKEMEKLKGELSNLAIATSQRQPNKPMQFKF